MDSKVSLTSWECELSRFGQLANLDLHFESYQRLVVTLEDVISKKRYVTSFSGVLGYRFERAFGIHRVGNTFKIMNSPWIESMQKQPFRTTSIETAQHYLISTCEGEFEVVSLDVPNIEVESGTRDSKNLDWHDRVISDFAEPACKRLSRNVIRSLTRMTDDMQSGDGMFLKNIWDEVCVQVQGEESAMWDDYLDTIESLILGEVARLDTATKQAIWLQTDEGIDWKFDEENNQDQKDQKIPIVCEDIAKYILEGFLLSAAADWTNKRIEKYLERGLEM